jgi:hypothetical protein
VPHSQAQKAKLLRLSTPYEFLIISLIYYSEVDSLLENSTKVEEKSVDAIDSKMSNSKELTPEKEEKRCEDGSIVSILYSAAKKVAVVGIVYWIGYMNWSVAWLICPLLLSVIRDQFRHKHDIRRQVAKASALASDKDVILARLNDLPAWVRKRHT